MAQEGINWSGVFPAITTKFTPNDEPDYSLMELNTTVQVEAGVSGIILAGTLGEASTLSLVEKDEILKYLVKKFGSQTQILMNVAENTTKQAVLAAQHAEYLGAKGIMLLPPMRYAADSHETVTFLKRVAESIKIPVLIYNNPVDYKIEITIDMFRHLLESENIQAVKESTRDVSNVTRLRNAFGNRLKILTGVDTLGMESLLMGADGWVAGLVCAFPRETVAIYRLVKAGRYAEALKIYQWFLPLLELDVSTKLVQNIKLAEMLEGIGNELVREPRLPLSGDERERVLGIIQYARKTRPQLTDYLNL